MEGLEGLCLWAKGQSLKGNYIDARMRWRDSHRRIKADSRTHLERKVVDRISVFGDRRWGMPSLWVVVYSCC